jgi:hypothetical protein
MAKLVVSIFELCNANATDSYLNLTALLSACLRLRVRNKGSHPLENSNLFQDSRKRIILRNTAALRT